MRDTESDNKLTPEHRAQMQPWAEKWIAMAGRCESLSDQERAEICEAVPKLYTAAFLQAPVNVVFADGPLSGAIATAIAAGVWYLRDHREVQQRVLGGDVDDARLMSAIPLACEFAVRRLHTDLREGPISDDDEALRMSIASTTRIALEAAKRSDPINDGALRVSRALVRAVEVSINSATRVARKVAIEAVEAAAAIVASDRAITAAVAPDGTPDPAAIAARAAVVGAAVANAVAEAFREGSHAFAQHAISASIDDAIRSEIPPLERTARWFELESAGHSVTAAMTTDSFRVTEGKQTVSSSSDPSEVVEILEVARKHAQLKDSRETVNDVHKDSACTSQISRTVFESVRTAIYGIDDVAARKGIEYVVENSVRDMDVRMGSMRHLTTALADDPVARLLIGCCGWLPFDPVVDYNTHAKAAYYSFYHHVVKLPVDFSVWANYEIVACAGPRYFCKRFCIVSDHPLELQTIPQRGEAITIGDPGGAPFISRTFLNMPPVAHSATGPSFRWRDGFFQYHWRGTAVPQTWIEHPETIDIRSVIFEPNAERRRTAIEILGWLKILDFLQARVVDENSDPQIGTLLEADLPDPNGQSAHQQQTMVARFLRVRCGTGRDFVLSVPREMKTALEANAWTFSIQPNEFKPEVRT